MGGGRIGDSHDQQDEKDFQAAQGNAIVESEAQQDQHAPQRLGLSHGMGTSVKIRQPEKPDTAHAQKDHASEQ